MIYYFKIKRLFSNKFLAKYRFILLICFGFLCPAYIKAQDVSSTVEQLIADIFEQYTAESEDEIDYDSFYEDLMFVAQNPININQATREQLEKLPFLSDQQIENILAYLYENGALKTIYELQLIEGLDMTDIRRMLPFIALGNAKYSEQKIKWKEVLKYGKNELFFRLDKGLETKEGYQFTPEEDENQTDINTKKYLGNAVYNSLKYRFHYKDRILVGITAEKDAGEQFWGSKHKGYDFYSAYAQLNNIGKFKTVVVGDFRANFGQGLVLHPEFGMGKSSYVLNVTSRNAGLKKYSSSDEINFFRGIGGTFQLGKVGITVFYSNKMIDGDTVNGIVSSLYKTGLHRTISELNKKHTINQQVLGGNATMNFSNFQVGFTAVHTILNTSLIPEKAVYNFHYFRGKNQSTGGVHYRWRLQKLNVFGETATTDRGALATINGFSFSPLSQVSLVVLHRYYAPEFDNFYASSFSESSRVNNENGLYIGTEIRPFRKWKIAAYADSYHFPWPKFGVDAPSLGRDFLLQADFAPQRTISMFWRLKYEEKEEKEENLPGSTATMPLVVPFRKTSLRYSLNYSKANFYFKNLVEANLAQTDVSSWTYGITISQDLSYDFQSIPLKIDFRYQFFDATNYENRFYSYEKDVLYAFSIPMYYGLGSRYYLNVQFEFNKNLALWFKIAQTVYADDRETLSSGNESIAGNRKTDVRLLVKWSF